MTYNEYIDMVGEKILIGDWNMTEDKGVWRDKPIYNAKGVVTSTQTEQASPIPIIPVAIYSNADSGVEKLELAFFKNHRWNHIIADRSKTANKNKIVELADKGVEVNSQNAMTLVTYISDVVANSLNTMPQKSAKSVLGWAEDEFMPYTDKYCFDGDENFKYLHRAIAEKGSLQEWCDFVAPLREASKELRLTMDASFASPIIERVGENPFVLELWGGTGVAKTVALMVSMSIFGNPTLGALTRTMNMTANSMLSTAAFLKNLPFAGDELQTIKSRWTNYDNLIMCITEGIDRGRMSYDKLNETKSWKCSFIFTGEEPCIKQESGGGAKNRVIEIECKEKLVQNGNLVANFVRSHYGTAGKPFIEKLVHTDVNEIYSKYFNDILNSCDTTDKQAGSMALILTADTLAGEIFFPDEKPLSIADIKDYLATQSETDVTERAYSFILDIISQRNANFQDGANDNWGQISNGFVFFNKTVLEKIMTESGFDFGACKSKWAYKGYIEKNSKDRYVHQRTVNGVYSSFVKIKIPPEEKEGEIDEMPF